LDVALSSLLKDSKIPNPIPQEPTTNEPRIAINKDNVGLAKDTTLSSVLPRNLTQISGTPLTARDWSGDFAKLQNLDVLLSSRASESTLSAIKNALASVGTDKLRVSPVDPFPLSPINLTQISGTALTGRDWSGDLAKLQNIDVALSSRLGADVSSAPDSSPPSKGVMILGFDGTYVRRVKTTADGRLLTVLG
jgi:hypothetical protein